MIYLFNSGFRPLYVTDVLNVLALPDGATVVHRYRVRGAEYQHVHPQLASALSSTPQGETVWRGVDRTVRALGSIRGLSKSIPQPAKVLLLFVDRDDGYKYHPLRSGTLHDTWERDNRLYFRVRLGDFIAAHPGRVPAVSDRIKFTLQQEGPDTPKDPAHPTRDGRYALSGDDAVGGHSDVVHGEDAWNAAVDSLSRTSKFKAAASRHVVFVRAAIGRRGAQMHEAPELSGELERTRIRKDTAYELRLSYRCNADAFDPPPAKLVLEKGDGLQLLDAGPLVVQALADDFVVPLITKRYAEDRYSHLNVAVRPIADEAKATVVGPNLDMLIAYRERRMFWFQVAGALVLFALSTLVVGVKPTDLRQSTSTVDFGRALWEQVTWWRLTSAGLQALVLFGLFRMIGKKPV
jgi:hypothetical protein